MDTQPHRLALNPCTLRARPAPSPRKRTLRRAANQHARL